MPHYLSAEELKRTVPADIAPFPSPVPVQIVSNGEFNPLPQTREQRRLEARIKTMADALGPKHGMTRRRFLASRAGRAAGVLGPYGGFRRVFGGWGPEAPPPGQAAARAKAPRP